MPVPGWDRGLPALPRVADLPPAEPFRSRRRQTTLGQSNLQPRQSGDPTRWARGPAAPGPRGTPGSLYRPLRQPGEALTAIVLWAAAARHLRWSGQTMRPAEAPPAS